MMVQQKAKVRTRKSIGFTLTLFTFLFLYLPIIIIFLISINNSTRGYNWEGFTLKWYQELLLNFNNPSSDLVIFRQAIVSTIWVALRSTFFATILGTIFAIGIHALNKRRRIQMMVLNNIPVVNPDIVTGISLMVIFSLLSFRLGESTVLLAHIFFSIPYVVLSVMPKLKRLDPFMFEAALDLGCSRPQAVRKVILPNISTGIIGGALIAFTMSIDDFVISYFTSGIDFENVSIWLYTKMKNPQNLNPTLYAYNVLIILVTIGVILYINLKKRSKGKKNMKKLVLLFLFVASLFVMIGCNQSPRLYVLNWGDYMDMELVQEFEKEFGVKVSYKPASSNEEMATLLQQGSNNYDIIIPSDYMIDKLIQEELIQPIQFNLLTNYESLNLMDQLESLLQDLPIQPYVVPYAWGTIGIMYNTSKAGIKEYIESNGWSALFTPSATYRVGMYDSPRDAVAASLLYLGYHVNSDNLTELAEAETALKNAQFTAFGEDNLKGLVISGNLDMALVYSGDYYSEYYVASEDGLAINFDFYVPEVTNVWMDGMVIGKNSQNVELAHQFIDFFLRRDVAIQNSDYIGYAPCYQEVFDELIGEEYGYDFESFDPFPVGSVRQMYIYGSDDRQNRIVQILSRVKN